MDSRYVGAEWPVEKLGSSEIHRSSMYYDSTGYRVGFHRRFLDQRVKVCFVAPRGGSFELGNPGINRNPTVPVWHFDIFAEIDHIFLFWHAGE